MLNNRKLFSGSGAPAGWECENYEYVTDRPEESLCRSSFVVLRNGTMKQTSHVIAMKSGEKYEAKLWVRALGGNAAVEFGPEGLERKFNVSANGEKYTELAFGFDGTDTDNGTFVIKAEGDVAVFEASLMPVDNFYGMRRDVIAALKEIAPSSVRFPGGCAADHFEWRESLKAPEFRQPVSAREKAWVLFLNSYDQDCLDVGLNEFIMLCRELGAEPEFTVSLVLSDGEDAAKLVEYCNGDEKTEFGAIRHSLGFDKFGIKYWFIGNEAYFFGFEYRDDGALAAKRTNELVHAMKRVDDSIVPILGLTWGATLHKWNFDFIANIDFEYEYISYHDYIGILPDATQGKNGMATLEMVEDLFNDGESYGLNFYKNTLYKDAFSGIKVCADEWNYNWGQNSNNGLFLSNALQFQFLAKSFDKYHVERAEFFMPVNEGMIFVRGNVCKIESTGALFMLMAGHKGGRIIECETGTKDVDVLCTSHGGKLFMSVVNRRVEPCVIETEGYKVLTAGQIRTGEYSFENNDFEVIGPEAAETAEVSGHSVTFLTLEKDAENEPGFARLGAVPFDVHNSCATRAEKRRAAEEYDKVISDTEHFPCSFAIDGVPQKGLVGFELVRHIREEKNRDTLFLRHKNGLEITVKAAHYPDFAAYEWTLWIKNTSDKVSPRINDLSSADVIVPGRDPVLSGLLGDARNENFGADVISPTYGMNNQPYDIPLALGQKYDLRPNGGCACNMEFPYFKLRTSAGSVFAAIGWPGQWRARFDADRSGVRFRAGQQILDTVLLPGESVRTPLTTFLIADPGDPDRLSNLWRRFMFECNMPRKNGTVPPPTLSATSIKTGLMTAATEENQLSEIRNLRAHGVHPEMWWMDAGWYYKTIDGKAPECLDDYAFTGTWTVRKEDFPTEIRAISDCMAEEGGTTLLWFEPERFGLDPETLKDDGTTLKKEWLLKGSFEIPRPRPYGTVMLPVRFVDLGNDAAREWLTEKICSVLERGNISVYREDHNIRPLDFFSQTDEPGRYGITENKYMCGHLQMWDEIRQRFGEMIIDSCASGGRRNDLESMRRAVPLHISDFFLYSRSTLAQRQAVMSALFAYLPYFKAEGPGDNIPDGGSGWYANSSMAPYLMVHIDPDTENELLWQEMREMIDRWEQIKYTFYADYYMLTEWNIDAGKWLAYEFIDSVTGDGSVHVFRRNMNDEPEKTLYLKGLRPDREYAVKDLMNGKVTRKTGRFFAENGLTVTLETPGSATVLKICESENFR